MQVEGATCGCGHELFTYISDSGWYQIVPAHGDLSLEKMRAVEVVGEELHVRDHQGKVFIIFRMENNQLVSQSGRMNPFVETKVLNPWRIWAPYFFAKVRTLKGYADDFVIILTDNFGYGI